jgi:cell division transport system permease protein
MPEIAEARQADPARLAALLRPWLGEAPAIPLPTVIELRLARLPPDAAALSARIAAAVPGATVESHGVWVARLLALARSLQAIALAALVLVAGIATAVVTVSVRAAVAARRDAIAILHELGATDGDIAGRFARRVALLAGLGGLGGTLLAAPVLAGFAGLAAPLLGGAVPDLSPAGLPWPALPWSTLPWGDLALLPPVAGLIGWCTTQVSLRLWLRRLP